MTSRPMRRVEVRQPETPLRAVLYLRVSTPSQVKTDYDPEGISLPAQRLACERRAEQLGNVEIVDEYVEPGRSATSMANRTAFQAMLQRIKAERDIDMVLIYKLSRMNRNRVDDALVMSELRRYNVQLVSATENIDESPIGQLMHGILATINEFRSAEEGADIRYKMGEKAKKGGTIGRAPLGYLNVIERFDGRDVRTVKVDPERGPVVQLAFELYATGDFTLQALSDELYERGLRSRPGRFPSTQVTDGKLASMLRNPYYIGRIVYDGEEYDGRQQPLIGEGLFETVQGVLDLRKGAGERDRRHQHLLKGMLWCGACHAQGHERRMILQRAKGNGGTYYYFFCRGRQEHVCRAPYLNVDLVESAVERHFERVRFTPEFITAVRAEVEATIDDQQRSAKLLRKQLQAQIARLDTQESNLIDLAAENTSAKRKVRQKLMSIERERRQLGERLEGADDRLAAGASAIKAALAVMEEPDELFRRSTVAGRRQIVQGLYEKIYIYNGEVTQAVSRSPFNDLIEGAALTQLSRDPTQGSVVKLSGYKRERTSPGALFARVAQADGSSKASLVGVRGFEPPASTSRTWRANQAALHPVSA